MKIVRYGSAGSELPGLIDRAGLLRGLAPLAGDITPDLLSPEGLAVLRAIDPERLPRVSGNPPLACPVAGLRQVIALGLNYRKHALEAGFEIPKEPVVFHKALGSLAGPEDDLVLPPATHKNDWEAELGFVIGTRASHVAPAEALAHVAGFCATIDFSERDWQASRGGAWNKGKSFDGYCPVGPWLVTADEVADPQKLDIWLEVNGVRRQASSTADMIFDVATIVSYLSEFMTLSPGDLVITGTPEGVALGMKAPQYLQAGDIVTMGISGLGTQRHAVKRRPG
jgi:2-keto-4-pentenoate hydratase/2-oxohepta-3-ene-1,7-dioic acid hydratase in catechol pathway